MESLADWMQQALAHHNRGELDAAAHLYARVLSREPRHADALHLMGVVAHQQGRNEEAVALLEQATAADAGSPQAHYNLSGARLALGDARGALAALARATALGADFAEIHYRTGVAHALLGDTAAAVACYGQALARDGDHLPAQHGLVECLQQLPVGVDPRMLQAVILPLLRARSINPRTLGHAAARLLEAKYGLGIDDAAPPAAQHLCERLLADEVVQLYLQRTVNVSVPLERLLTACRAHWLADREAALAPDAIAAVAMQCFLNEFVWIETPEETRGVVDLEQRIIHALAGQASSGSSLVTDVLVFACYRPLWCSAFAAQLMTGPSETWPDALTETLRVSLREPLWEQERTALIDTGVTIRDGVSRAVQSQYEENPYPRWQALTRARAQGIEQRLRRWNPDYSAPPQLRGPLQVLVAGCGTGMDAVDTALHLNNAIVTAVDLSRASIAYAMRKAHEYGLENIRFRQEDILDIEHPGKPYHVINCTGVLHHMRDPAAGLKRLVDVLESQGLIRLALYSRLAREPLLQVREAIRERGFDATRESIRSFRQQVIDDGAHGLFAELMGSTDFFSVSECRDLLFHVQETQLSVEDIGRLLEQTGLEFLGFELTIDEVEKGFRREHPRAALTDLDAWAEYEERHPHSFRAMYQFWCRKLQGDLL